MSNPSYLHHMKITPDMLKSLHLQPVSAYLGQRDEMEQLRALMEGENALLIHGDLEAAVTNLQSVYDSIPDSEAVVRQHAHIALLEAKRCQRHAQPTR